MRFAYFFFGSAQGVVSAVPFISILILSMLAMDSARDCYLKKSFFIALPLAVGICLSEASISDADYIEDSLRKLFIIV